MKNWDWKSLSSQLLSVLFIYENKVDTSTKILSHNPYRYTELFQLYCNLTEQSFC